MNPSQRVVLNTAATYGRSIVGLGLALFSSRWVLAALGQSDFGLFSVVGSIIVFITILNAVMSGSVARHYAYAIGHGNPGEVNRWFNTALGVHLALATVLVLVGWPVGEYFIAHVLSIPLERIPACLWVFRVSLVAAFFSMVSMPFVAMFTAQQRMIEQSGWLLGQATLIFFLAMQLERVAGDRLMFYAAGMVAIIVFVQLAQMVHAGTIFKECRIQLRGGWDGTRVGKIFSFAGWTIFGALGGTLRDQGCAILLNLHFGPKLNAAYGIALQVSTAASMLTNAMIGAIAPEMTSSEGRGDRERMLSLAQRANKFGTLLVMLFAVPLIAEMHYVLKLWLVTPPAYTALFCQLILVTMLIDRLSGGTWLAVSAYGRIAAYQSILGLCHAMTLPLAWLFFQIGAPPTSVGVVFIVMIIAATICRVLLMRRYFGVPVSRWLKDIVLPCGMVAVAAVATVSLSCWLVVPSIMRLMMTGAAGMAIMLLTAWCVALDRRERQFIGQNSWRLLYKMRHGGNRQSGL